MLLYPLARDAPHLGIKPESSYISCIGRNALYYCHLGSTKYWYKRLYFVQILKSKKKKKIIKYRREKVELRKVICKIIFIETMY